MHVLQLSLTLLLFVAAGFIARKTGAMQDGFDRMLSRFVLALPLPCMIVNSFHIQYSLDNILTAPFLLLLGVVCLAANFGLAVLVTRRIQNRDMRRTVCFALLFTNFTFVGFPVVQQLYGFQGFFYYVIFTLPVRLVFYGGASVMLGRGGERIDVRETLKRFLCEPVIAVFIGFFLYAAQIQLPEVLDSCIASIGAMASPLGLMLCGSTLADADLRSALRQPAVVLVTLGRLLAVPAVFVLALRLAGLPGEILRPLLFYFAMPVASLTPTFLLRYNPEAVEARTAAGYMVVASTLICVATIPLWSVLAERLLP